LRGAAHQHDMYPCVINSNGFSIGQIKSKKQVRRRR